ncbi:MAG: Gmad2 immunoglobulin-like domain-containing protein [Patescibacteria group bacterium]
MQRSTKILAIICFVGLLVSLFVCIHSYRGLHAIPNDTVVYDDDSTSTESVIDTATTSQPDLEPVNAPATTTSVIIDSPIAGSVVTSPLTVTGKAPGPWFFEATAGLVILNSDKQVVSQARVDAQGDWMVTGLVPFTSTITYPASLKGKGGYIRFLSDNASGIPENQKSFTIPVLFR